MSVIARNESFCLFIIWHTSISLFCLMKSIIPNIIVIVIVPFVGLFTPVQESPHLKNHNRKTSFPGFLKGLEYQFAPEANAPSVDKLTKLKNPFRPLKFCHNLQWAFKMITVNVSVPGISNWRSNLSRNCVPFYAGGSAIFVFPETHVDSTGFHWLGGLIFVTHLRFSYIFWVAYKRHL